jgi:hypothetical protein
MRTERMNITTLENISSSSSLFCEIYVHANGRKKLKDV